MLNIITLIYVRTYEGVQDWQNKTNASSQTQTIKYRASVASFANIVHSFHLDIMSAFYAILSDVPPHWYLV